MTPRDYQLEAYHASHAAWESHRRIDGVMATGLGKTEVLTMIAHQWQTGRVLVVEPLNELVDQTARKICERTGIMPGIEQADRWSNESDWCLSPYVVASIHTLCSSKNRYKRFRGIDLVVVDERHIHNRRINLLADHFEGQGSKLLGLTATPGKDQWHRAFTYGIDYAVEGGWLVTPWARCIQLESLDLSEVKLNREGDFVEADLAAVMEEEKVVFEVAEVVARESFDGSRPLKTAVYTASVSEARKVAHRLVDTYGIKADWVCGDRNECSPERRKDAMRSFHADPHGIQVMCNYGVLTIGWDFPGLEHIVMARPTNSLDLFTQIVGRGLRPLKGVVDFEGSTAESRKAAIAASGKPTIKISDLRDNSLAYKLVTTVDAVAGGASKKARERAKKEIEKSPVSLDVIEALRRATLHEQKLDRQRMRRVEAKAKYNQVEADLFDRNQRGKTVKAGSNRVARMPFGADKGKPLSELPEGKLRWVIRQDGMPAWLKKSCRTELYFRTRRQGSSDGRDDVNQLLLDAAYGAPAKPKPEPVRDEFLDLLGAFTEGRA